MLAGGYTMRRLLVHALAVLTFGAAALSTARRSIEDWKIVFVDSPREIVPAGLNEQVNTVKSVVPAGSTVFYLMDKFDPWQLGLWQRAMYPDYMVLPAEGIESLNSRAFRTLRADRRIEFVISSGSPAPDPGFQAPLTLPSYVFGTSTILGKLRSE